MSESVTDHVDRNMCCRLMFVVLQKGSYVTSATISIVTESAGKLP